jgi:uncharacterized protein (DUF2062 family)
MSEPAPPSLQQESWWRRRVLAPLKTQLRQGTSPRMIAVTVAAGCVLSVFPILGSTTILCAVIAAAFGLNQPLIQTVNYLLYPAQIALLFPLYRAGEWLFQQPPVPLFSLTELTARFWNSPGQFFIDYGLVAVYGIVAWALIALPTFGLLVLTLHAPIRTLAARMRRADPVSAAHE